MVHDQVRNEGQDPMRTRIAPMANANEDEITQFTNVLLDLHDSIGSCRTASKMSKRNSMKTVESFRAKFTLISAVKSSRASAPSKIYVASDNSSLAAHEERIQHLYTQPAGVKKFTHTILPH